MSRSSCLVAMFSMVIGCGPLGGTSSRLERPAWLSPLDEAAQLDQAVDTLRRACKFQDAVPPAERSLMLREKVLGPRHPAVAMSLNTLAALYRAQANYARAEPLAIRGLDIREKTPGPVDADLAQSLNEVGLLFLEQAAFDKAEPLLVRALELREKTLGAMHSEVAQSLHGLAELYRAREQYSKAESLLARALAINEAAFGPMHVEVATTLSNLAELYRLQGAFEKAEPLYRRALQLREKTLGPMHPDVGKSVGGVAMLHSDRGAYAQAEPLYVRALDIAERALGPMHPEVARSLNNLGELYRMLGAYDKAKALHVRALNIAETALGAWHPDVARSLNDIANVDWFQGAFSEAEALHTRALAIHEKVFGPLHTQVARSLNNLAMVVQDEGASDKAEPLYLRALAINEKALGPTHPRVANILSNFATLYLGQGAYRDAERLQRRALDILERSLGPTHADVALSLFMIAHLHHIQGQYEKSESLYMRAIDITEKTLGPMHPDLANFLNNLAWLYREQRMYRKAEPLMLRALEIVEKTLGPMHVRNANILESLASIYRDQRQFDKAKPFVLRAFDIREKTLGPTHPWMTVVLKCLAKLYWAQGAFEKVEPLLSRAAELREQQLRLELPRMSEPRKRALMMFLKIETDSVVSLHAHGLPRSRSTLDLALTTTLRRKGRSLDSMVDNGAALRAHLIPPLRAQLDELDRARSELVAQLYSGRYATDRAALATVRTRIEDLEATLSAASADFRATSEPVTVAKVQSAIPPDAALVEFVRYHRFDPQEVQPSREERYVAYLVTRQGPLQWVALGAAAAIDPYVDATLAAMTDKVPAALAKAALRRLDALILAPIRARLPGVSHLILAPDGKLNLVPFEALVDERGNHAVDSYLVSYVTTGRDLLRLAAPAKPRSAAVIVAGPDYGPLPAAPGPVSFSPLADALGEAADLGRYFPTPPLTGEQATKIALKALAGPAMLHVATHGFYAQNHSARPMPAPGNPSREMFADSHSAVLPPPDPDDPADGLDRAGLAMAGANLGPAGIVTAREIAGFDWSGTQLVVLSACQTGVGAVPSGDGVYGMRRALVLAGATSQVVSLWNVDDAATRALMRDYYSELARGTGRAEALRTAKRRLMRQPRFSHPHDWAAFIAAGDWQPLDQGTIPQQPLTP